MQPPNFVVFMTDQQRADHLGCYGNRTVRTPHIDGLAAEGVVFDRCYVASPVCMPNRAAMMTGRMPSAAGVRMNGVPLPLEARTFVDALRTAGYRTALIGKSHLQNMTAAPPVWRDAGWRLDYQATRDARDSRAYEQESIERWRDPTHRVSLPYYGFEHVELCLEHGDQVGGDYVRWLAAQDVAIEEVAGPDNALPVPGLVAPQAWRTRVSESQYPSAFVGERTRAWIEAHARGPAREQPFFLQCSFPDPHHPFTPPGRYWDLYAPEAVALPATCGAAAGEDPPLKRALHAELEQGKRTTHSSRVIAVTAEEARQAIALNYGSISMIDDMIGGVIECLRRTGLLSRTVLIFLSDHGDFMGDHGLLFKGPLHYQSLIRMPFVWRDPDLPHGVRRAQLASAIDLAPTVLARAGIAPYYGVQGLSLLDAMRDAATPTRAELLVEEAYHRSLPGFSAPPVVRTLVTERWRLSVHAHAEWAELYDRDADPTELLNLWRDAAHLGVRADLLWRMVQSMQRLGDHCPLPVRMA